jgi:cysteine-rich repeat protein
VLRTILGGADCNDHGDGGPAVAAGMVAHARLALDPRGGLVFVDNNHVRRIDLGTGIVQRIFGNDDLAFTPDGLPAAGSAANLVTSVGVDVAGNVYVTEQESFRVRRIDALTGLLSTAIGTGVDGRNGAGDGGPATLAEISFPWSVVVTHTDRIYVAEGATSRIRVVASGPHCGDWTIDPGEGCDDGNLVGGDCCSPTCTLASTGSVCRASTGECDPAETCDGLSGLCPAAAFVASGAACTSDGNLCTDDVCNGAGACVHGNNTAPCNDNVFCNGADACSGGACRVHPGNPCSGGGECANSCDESRDTCNVVAGVPCSLDEKFCTDDVCDGNGACIHPPARAGETCRAVGGDCDVAEACDGVAPDCPPNAFGPPTVVCRASAGECDRADSCSGTSAQCPPDAFAPVGTACTPDAVTCTADVCNGGGACTHPPGNAGVVCRTAAGVCDVAEVCDGVAAACPADAFRDATVVCREAAGECDRADACSGASALCPANGFAPGGTSCTPDALPCTADVCDGSGACTHPAGNVGVVCRTAADVCDVAERCDGASTSCPPDAFQPATVPCRAASGACDLAETCDGTRAGCPADGGVADTDTDGSCDAQDPCTNVGGDRDFLTSPRSSLVLTKVHTSPVPGDDGLKLSALFALPEGRSFAELRPHMHGVRIVLEGAGGARPLDATLPPGAYSAATRRGWQPSGSGKAWTYLDRRATPVNGIVKLVLTDRSRTTTPRQVKVVVTGKRGAYPVTPGDVPVQAIVTLGDATDATGGLCGESAYAADSCAFNGAGNQLVCTR